MISAKDERVYQTGMDQRCQRLSPADRDDWIRRMEKSGVGDLALGIRQKNDSGSAR